ncbi:MAG: amino acid ABC transporter permease [Candidatus Hadarchaeum sp.]
MLARVFTSANIELLLRGAGHTLLLSSVGIIFGAMVGGIFAIVRTYPTRLLIPVRILIWIYTEIFRRTPLLILILLSYFGLAIVKIKVSNLFVALVAVSAASIAYMAENIRAGINSLPYTQWEAGFALGLRGFQVLYYVVLPQALRISIPPSIGFFQSLIKDTSMATIIGIVELTHAGVILRYRFPLASFYIFGAVMVAYFLICFPLSWAGDRVERRLKRG